MWARIHSGTLHIAALLGWSASPSCTLNTRASPEAKRSPTRISGNEIDQGSARSRHRTQHRNRSQRGRPRWSRIGRIPHRRAERSGRPGIACSPHGCGSEQSLRGTFGARRNQRGRTVRPVLGCSRHLRPPQRSLRDTGRTLFARSRAPTQRSIACNRCCRRATRDRRHIGCS